MKKKQLVKSIREKENCLCVGLDSDLDKLPSGIDRTPEGILSFNKAIIDATKDDCVAYKINTAFYERLGWKGWKVIEDTVAYIPDTHFKIADAKRGDIGNTSHQYAITFFKEMPFDALTVAPYMGEDSLKPFLEIYDKWIIVLGLTSNRGSQDFQKLKLKDGELVWQKVIRTVCDYGTEDNLMFVVGATRSDDLKLVRNIIPNHFLLVPGVGAQGGSLSEVMENGMNKDCGLLINASRSIIFASNGLDFAEKAHLSALKLHLEMKNYF